MCPLCKADRIFDACRERILRSKPVFCRDHYGTGDIGKLAAERIVVFYAAHDEPAAMKVKDHRDLTRCVSSAFRNIDADRKVSRASARDGQVCLFIYFIRIEMGGVACYLRLPHTGNILGTERRRKARAFKRRLIKLIYFRIKLCFVSFHFT